MLKSRVTSPSKKMESMLQKHCIKIDSECRDIELKKYELKSKNTSALFRIQEVMNLMEGKTYTLDQVLERIIRL